MTSIILEPGKKNDFSIKLAIELFMLNKAVEAILSGGDLRSIGKSNSVVLKVNNQSEFDDLFKFLFHPDRIIVMRAADAIEKITFRHNDYLQKHKKEILQFCKVARDIEFKWHLALLSSRLKLKDKEVDFVWQTLSNWAKQTNESKIVRVNSLQGLYNILQSNTELTGGFNLLVRQIKQENIASLNARIKKLMQNKKM